MGFQLKNPRKNLKYLIIYVVNWWIFRDIFQQWICVLRIERRHKYVIIEQAIEVVESLWWVRQVRHFTIFQAIERRI